jgi:hypothetical protein
MIEKRPVLISYVDLIRECIGIACGKRRECTRIAHGKRRECTRIARGKRRE